MRTRKQQEATTMTRASSTGQTMLPPHTPYRWNRFTSPQRGHDRKSAVTALEKLDALSGGGSAGTAWLSTHPAPRDRADRMRRQAVA